VNRHKVPFEEIDTGAERRALLVRCNDLTATVRERENKIEQLEHMIAHLRYQLDLRPKKRWRH
jgi:hypothetical protein